MEVLNNPLPTDWTRGIHRKLLLKLHSADRDRTTNFTFGSDLSVRTLRKNSDMLTVYKDLINFLIFQNFATFKFSISLICPSSFGRFIG